MKMRSWPGLLRTTDVPPLRFEQYQETSEQQLAFLQTLKTAYNELDAGAVRTLSGRLSALAGVHRKSDLYGAFAWARRALNRPKRRFPARAADARILGVPRRRGRGRRQPRAVPPSRLPADRRRQRGPCANSQSGARPG
jgi:hypothetical protein